MIDAFKIFYGQYYASVAVSCLVIFEYRDNYGQYPIILLFAPVDGVYMLITMVVTVCGL